MQHISRSAIKRINCMLSYGQRIKEAAAENEGDTVAMTTYIELPNGITISGNLNVPNDVEKIAEVLNEWARLNYREAVVIHA